MKRLLKWLLILMPACLYLSYHPVISIGANETMNFEFSVAEIWLVVFDIVAFLVLCQEKKLFSGSKRWWLWVLFPVWITLSVVWSLNTTRGLLTAGLLWALVFAAYAIWTLRGIFDRSYREKWWKWFFGTTLVVCAWCAVQCILDLAGVSQECSLLCDGCTYRMFGFPHPNGFAIEPQFMGNLLLAPIFASLWLLLGGDCNGAFRTRVARARRYGARALILGRNLRNVLKAPLPIASKKTTTGLYSSKSFGLLAFIFITTLFLTFSRGAIYAFGVGLLFMSGFVVARGRKKERKNLWKRVGAVWGVTVGAFVVALVAQGVMAEVSLTSDTFGDGIAKVVNHLSLGMIKTKSDDSGKAVENSVEEEVEKLPSATEERPNRDIKEAPTGKVDAVFDGYVAESTDTRVRLTGAAVQIWSGDFKTAVIGVGLGGAGQALFNNGLSPAPKEIVQNEYASLLLETGIIGVVLFVLIVVLIVRFVLKQNSSAGLILSLLVAYGVTLVFFSGLPNVLHIVLMPVMLMVVSINKRKIEVH